MIHSKMSFKLISSELLLNSEKIKEYFTHKVAIGIGREKLLESYIRKIMPKALSLTTGFLYKNGISSAQSDIIIFDRNNFGTIFEEGGFSIVQPEAVTHSIEVKSKLYKNELFDSINNIISSVKLNQKIFGIIFAYQGMTLKNALNKIQEFYLQNKNIPNILSYMPTTIVCLGKYVITSELFENGDRIYACSINNSFEEQFSLFFSSLYYKMYGYIRKLYNNKLPSLRELGYDLKFNMKETYFIHLKNDSIN